MHIQKIKVYKLVLDSMHSIFSPIFNKKWMYLVRVVYSTFMILLLVYVLEVCIYNVIFIFFFFFLFRHKSPLFAYIRRLGVVEPSSRSGESLYYNRYQLQRAIEKR